MSALTVAVPAEPPRRDITAVLPRADRRLALGLRGAALTSVSVLGLIGLFLLIKAWPALHRAGWGFLTERRWLPDVGRFGIASVLEGTIVIASIALVVALPVAVAVALFISEAAPPRLRSALISVVDLMAAVPSIVYGLWGFFFLQPRLITVSRWIAVHVGGAVPFLSVHDPSTASSFTSSAFIVGVTLSLMVLPIATSVMRQVFAQTPQAEREAAYALGCTRWAMIRGVVLPFGRSGIVGGAMLGLGRALGESISVFIIVSPVFTYTTHPLQSGSNTIAALIVERASESSTFGVAALLAAGLVLFAFTLVVNTVAGIIVARSRSGAATEI
ncbi:MAG TPA: phosphate ABC transporter permease subunit PstC [Mycobacteriales bacterium]|nr:phosphate ABC transporter permease subunit PstC [Mycobacteriales bacterium]